MEVTATMKFVRLSSQKVRGIARCLKGMPAGRAVEAMSFDSRKGAALILKTLKSAIANAENNAKLAAESLVVKQVAVEEGTAMKRYRPRARGGAGRIRKRTSHIRVVLAESDGSGKGAVKSWARR